MVLQYLPSGRNAQAATTEVAVSMTDSFDRIPLTA
jgi:hypothetical protein